MTLTCVKHCWNKYLFTLKVHSKALCIVLPTSFLVARQCLSALLSWRRDVMQEKWFRSDRSLCRLSKILPSLLVFRKLGSCVKHRGIFINSSPSLHLGTAVWAKGIKVRHQHSAFPEKYANFESERLTHYTYLCGHLNRIVMSSWRILLGPRSTGHRREFFFLLQNSA